MKYSEARSGRIFVIRLEDGDILHQEIEKFAEDQNIRAATIIALGGADTGSTFITGPEQGRAETIVPMEHVLDDVNEVVGTGTLFPNEQGKMVLHMHLASGRADSTITGCVRKGVKVWHILEVVIHEIVDSTGIRKIDAATGFELLEP